MLPLKQSSRRSIVEVARVLQSRFAQINEAWRRRMLEEFAFDDKVIGVLERVNISTTYRLFVGDGNFEPYTENLSYFGTRLAKLKVDTRAVARSLEICQELCEPYLRELPVERRFEAVAALETLSSASYVALSGAYFDAQRRELSALLSVLDSELSAGTLSALLSRVLEVTVSTFRASVGMLLLLDETSILRVHASVGFDAVLGDDFGIRIGQGFPGHIAETGEPDLLPDINESNGGLNVYLQQSVTSLWGVPLKSSEKVIGVLLIGFPRRYEWLPTECELMRAIADRSALAIDRARMMDALREREARIAELSAHLLKVQEEERKRISRELHDETGQALMVIRLYLGMLENSLSGRTAKAKIRETLGVVDRTIEGIRRIIGRLSPLVLQELGLIAAIRKEAKDLAKSTGVKARVAISDSVGRLSPEHETAIYRVVQEALHNVAKHAQAKSVNIQMARENGCVRLLIEDDGIGMAKAANTRERQTFGLAGIRERIGVLGGTVKITSVKGSGTKLDISVPVQRRVDSAMVAAVGDEGSRSATLEQLA
jgi:signal transduction histidine kinase